MQFYCNTASDPGKIRIRTQQKKLIRICNTTSTRTINLIMIENPQKRLRRRYLDILMNPSVRDTLLKRTAIIRFIRRQVAHFLKKLFYELSGNISLIMERMLLSLSSDFISSISAGIFLSSFIYFILILALQLLQTFVADFQRSVIFLKLKPPFLATQLVNVVFIFLSI